MGTNDAREAVDRLRKMLKGIRSAMLTTQEPDGCLRSRPMATQEVAEDGSLWFFTGRSTSKVGEIQHHQEVNLAYVDEDDSRFVSVSGRAELVDDRKKMEALWSPRFKAWFPDGLEDPDLVLLRVQAESVEFWDSASSRLVQLAGYAKVAVTGELELPPQH